MRLHLPDDWTSQLDALERALEKPDRPFAMTALTPIAATREILSWSEAGARRRTDRGRRDWGSLVEEYRESLGMAGSALSRTMRAPMSQLTRELSRRKSYADISSRSRALLSAFTASVSAGAAWDDLLEAAATSQYDEYCARRETFLDIVRLNAHDLTTFGTHSTAIDVLADSAAGLAVSSRMLGDPGDIAEMDPLERAGATVAERLSQVRRLWMSEARNAHNTVWFTYERALLDSNGPTRVGRVAFFPGSRLLWLLENAPDSPELPTEARDNRKNVLSWCPADDGGQMVVAMVNMGRGPIGGAVALAREITEATLDLFGRRVNHSWLDEGRMIHFIDGQVGPSGHGLGSREVEAWRPFERDDVADALITHDGQISVDLPVSRLREPLDLLRTLRKRGSPVDTLIAATRGMELVRANATECGSWQIFAREFVRYRWIVSEAVREFMDSLFYTDSDRRRSWVRSQTDPAALDEMVGLLRTSDGMIDLGAMHENALAILGSLEEGWIPARRLKRATQVMSPSSAYRLINRLDHRFDRHLARLSRCRNSITHGGSDCTNSSISVERFAQQLGFFSLNSYVDSLALGEVPYETLAARRDRACNELSAIRVGDFASVVAARV